MLGRVYNAVYVCLCVCVEAGATGEGYVGEGYVTVCPSKLLTSQSICLCILVAGLAKVRDPRSRSWFRPRLAMDTYGLPKEFTYTLIWFILVSGCFW